MYTHMHRTGGLSISIFADVGVVLDRSINDESRVERKSVREREREREREDQSERIIAPRRAEPVPVPL